MYRIAVLVSNGLLTLVGISYPLVWLFEPQNEPVLRSLSFLMALLWLMRGSLHKVRFQRYFAVFMACLLTFVGITRSLEMMYWYPVLINGVMLLLFGGSLYTEQSLVERFARLQMPDLPPQGIIYTRRVTQLWCGVFIFNIIVSTILILLENYYYWAIYTGVLSYILLGVVMTCEYIVRQIVMKKY